MATEEEIYRVWDYDHDSGAGSNPEFAKEYIQFVSNFIRNHRNRINTVVDLGCGDYQVGSLINYHGAEVTAVDASLRHIKNHKKKHKDRDFVHADVRTFDDSEFDLAIVKDVIQHWELGDIQEWLARPHARLMLICNDINPETNQDVIKYTPVTEQGRLTITVRGINLAAPPFNLECQNIFEFNGKRVFLVKRK